MYCVAVGLNWTPCKAHPVCYSVLQMRSGSRNNKLSTIKSQSVSQCKTDREIWGVPKPKYWLLSCPFFIFFTSSQLTKMLWPNISMILMTHHEWYIRICKIGWILPAKNGPSVANVAKMIFNPPTKPSWTWQPHVGHRRPRLSRLPGYLPAFVMPASISCQDGGNLNHKSVGDSHVSLQSLVKSSREDSHSQ